MFQSIQLVQELDPHLPPVLGDKSKLEQVFINLLMNGGESMQGEGRLTVSTAVAQGGDLVLIRFTGHRPRHPGTLAQPSLRSVLHHQGSGQGRGPGIVHQLRHHSETHGADLRGADRERGDDLCHRTPGAPGIAGQRRGEPDLEKKSTNPGAGLGAASRRPPGGQI